MRGSLFEVVERLFEASKRNRNTDARLIRLEDDEDRRLAGLELLHQRVVDHHLRIACERMAALERRMPHILIVDFETESWRQQDAERSEDAQHARAVREPLEVDGQPDVVAVFRGYALHERADAVLGAGRRILTHDLPGTVLRFDGSLLRARGLDRAGEQERGEKEKR